MHPQHIHIQSTSFKLVSLLNRLCSVGSVLRSCWDVIVVFAYYMCMQAESKHFITMETLDAAISHALANPVSYEYALKPSGEKVQSQRMQESDS